MVPVPRPRLRKVGDVHIGQAELRTYATLLWIFKTLVVGYVLVSLSTKGGFAGVRCVLNACHSAWARLCAGTAVRFGLPCGLSARFLRDVCSALFIAWLPSGVSCVSGMMVTHAMLDAYRY